MARRAKLQDALEKEEAYAELAQALVNDYVTEREDEEVPYESVMDDMNPEEVDNVIGRRLCRVSGVVYKIARCLPEI
jgi:hypothetical protein